jgi:hypothetical protein
MNGKEYAQHRGVSFQHISQLKRQGKLVLAADNRIDVARSDSRLKAFATAGEDKKNDGYYAVRVRKEKLLVEQRQLQLAKLKGTLVNGEEMRKRYGERVLACRTRLLGLGHKVAQFVNADERARICALVDEEIAVALTELGSSG